MTSVERVPLAYNNVYLVSDGAELVVIDTGPDYRGAREELLAALAGRTPDLVVATHGHLDHAGLGGWWQERGVPVLLGEADLGQAIGHTDSDIDHLEAYVASVGAPEEVVIDIQAGLEQRRTWQHDMRTRQDWRDAGDGRWPTALRYAPFQPEQLESGNAHLPCGLELLASPGHTPGNLVVVHDGEGWLFSGDQLLPEITPTPAIQFDGGERFPSLPRFLHSLDALERRNWAPARCFPGHGEPFDDVQGVIATNLSQASVRTQRLLEALRESGPATVYQIAEGTYPRAVKRRFWQIIATIQGHLDVLAEERRAVIVENRWSAIG